MAFDISKFIGRFVEEAREHVTALNKGMLDLEKRPDDMEIIHQIFRAAHTIKGSSRMLKLPAISEIAHKVEDVFGALREGKISFSSELAMVLFKGIDSIAYQVEKTARGETTVDDQSKLMQMLEAAAEGRIGDEAEAEVEEPDPGTIFPPRATSGESPEPSGQAAGSRPAVEEKAPVKPAAPGPEKQLKHSESIKVNETIRVGVEKLSELIRLASEITSRHSRAKQSYLEVHQAAKHLELLAEKLSPGDGGHSTEIVASTGMELGQMAKALKKISTSIKDDFVIQNLLIRDLQERSLQLRMLPLSTIFDTFHRSVREIVESFEKEVSLSIVGGDIEMDKKIIEKLGDPLTHMLRNAVDHGLESPEERQRAGKPARGKINLSACYEGGKVLIVLEDDGHGLVLDKIKAKALKSGLVGQDSLEAMSVSELQNLIFRPGFSTSSIITDISGRGVGMDVVRKNIVDDLKGSISIESIDGQGTTFQLRLPMTLAIMHVVMVEVGGSIFALPDNYINEILRVKTSGIIEVFDKMAVNIREELVPVETLHSILGLPGHSEIHGDDLLLLIVKVGAERLGLIVDAIIDEEDMVIKSLPKHMNDNKIVSGVILTGRDQVVNVLNVPSIFLAAKEVKSALARPERAEVAREIKVLVVDDSVNTREIEKSILEAYGYQVTLAGDGVEALEKARKVKYDIIITDVEMPKMDGFTLTETLRADEVYKDTPIMLLTSRDKDEDKRRGIQVGANAYILKGDFEQSNLISTIENLL
ncbi:MAG: hybrid sensor histidine kinase/response regulator [Proteobacteria bacterium]|nr:hybrid sensor histidine kinase/response regulator [Pseudomonadota bacterium]MBU1687304.1 hybrid sensor histidine kinase/response regulator [Pseudomonadota bacterium]